MRFHEKLGFRLTQHAYYQYCRRVDQINWHELINRIRRHIEAGDFYLSGKEFANVGGVWWVYRRRGDCVYFVTCYGRSHLDLPRALKWAARHRDRIVLGR